MCEEWIWLPPEERKKIQQEKNAMYNRMLDSLALTPGKKILSSPEDDPTPAPHQSSDK